MTPEQIDKTIEFLIQHSATFSAQMDELKLRQEELARQQGQANDLLLNLTRQTAKFESWASEVIAIESRRLDEHDRLHRDALRLLNGILDRLPPVQ